MGGVGFRACRVYGKGWSLAALLVEGCLGSVQYLQKQTLDFLLEGLSSLYTLNPNHKLNNPKPKHHKLNNPKPNP